MKAVEKIETSVLDPDPHGSVVIWLSRIRIHVGNVDPDPMNKKIDQNDK
jgi:hypothetical protein